MEFTRLERFSLGRSNGVDEDAVQNFIESDLSVLGLGVTTRVIGKQRRHQGAGILDLLLESEDKRTRYVVELMLGDLDESHIIRAIEYWDIERRAYPEIAHVAVLVAEGLGRFLSVIGLLSGAGRIPLMVIQMTALKIETNRIALTFSRVLDQQRRQVEDDDSENEPARVQTWAERVPQEIMAAIHSLFEKLNSTARNLVLRETTAYIAVSPIGTRQTNIIFCPQRKLIQMEIRTDQTQEMDEKLNGLGEYDSRYRRYILRIRPNDVDANANIFIELGQIFFPAPQAEAD